MGNYCRRVGYLYSNLSTLPECVGCIKAIFSREEMRVCVCLTGKRLKCGETKLYLLLYAGSKPVTCLLDVFSVRPNVREYCFQYCRSQKELPCGEAAGFLLLTEGQTLGCSFCGRGLCLETWMPKAGPEEAGETEEENGDGVGTGTGVPENPLEQHLSRQEKACEEETEALRSCGELPFALCAEELLQKRPMMQPFLQCEYERCVRISLSDLHLLQGVANIGPGNSFLCHSYYRYRHLLLARKRLAPQNAEAETDGQEFWLLAPGIGNSREQQMSALYGFTAFRSIHGRGCRGGYGYWCMQLLFRSQAGAERLEKVL